MRVFKPHPKIALGKSKFDPKKHEAYYKYDYIEIEKRIESGYVDKSGNKWTREAAYRNLILNDLWFLLYFVMGIPDVAKPNHPFVVNRCNEVEESNCDFVLDVWAREHYKTSVKTIGKNIQRILKNPETANAIFSHKASVSKVFLFEIKQHFENSEILRACFPDILYENPQREAPRWSLDDGLIVKRKTNRREATISAHGLTEGMPVGLHFNHMDFDDIVTADIGDSVDVMEKVKERFDVAMNMGTDGGTHTVTGTFYHFNDPLTYIRDKVNPETGGKAYKLRFYPSTKDGSPSGEPVFNSPEREAQLRLTKTYRTQQLCDPLPVEYVKLKPEHLDYVDEAPVGLYKFIIVDQAGDAENNVADGDDWAISTFGVQPYMSDIGASDIYILDIFSERLGESEGIDLIVQKYIDAGFVMVLGIEKEGLSSTHTHVQEALRKQRGRFLTIVNDITKKRNSVILLLHAPRRKGVSGMKKKFIESAIEWPLNNGKIHVLNSIPVRYREKLELEMKQHPYGKSDNIINTIAYLIRDIVLQYHFPVSRDIEVPEYQYVDEGMCW